MAPKAIQVTVAIRQTFSTIGIVMFTSESMSHSTASSLEESDDSGVKRLTNVPRIPVRERSIVHDGAAVLRIISNPQRALEGEYRTNRKSTGELSLRYEGARIAEVL
jgi:SMODS-associating 2TM, beta-strand rich effector domain